MGLGVIKFLSAPFTPIPRGQHWGIPGQPQLARLSHPLPKGSSYGPMWQIAPNVPATSGDAVLRGANPPVLLAMEQGERVKEVRFCVTIPKPGALGGNLLN